MLNPYRWPNEQDSWVQVALKVPKDFPVCMQRDKSEGGGAKEFSGFRTASDAVDYIKWFMTTYPEVQPCFYETIKDKNADPVHILMDIERDFTAEEAASDASRELARGDTWDAIVRLIEQLLKEICGEPITLVPGRNCQVLESLYPQKFSRHLLIYTPGFVSMRSLALVNKLYRRCFDMPPANPIRPLLVYRKPDGRLMTVFDQTVYSMNQAMRMPFCCKLGENNPLLPILGSSSDIAAHLVNVVPPDLFSPPEMLPPVDLDKLLQALKPQVIKLRVGGSIETRHALDGGTDDGDLTPIHTPTPLWQPGQMESLRKDLIGHTALKATIRVKELIFKDGGAVGQDGSYFYFYIKRMPGQDYATCPYAQRIHAENDMSIIYNHTLHRVSIHCYHAECSLKACGVPRECWRVTLPEEVLAATAADFGEGDNPDCTLHACASRVTYINDEDKYCDANGMRPYPNDRLLAVVAGMGTGMFHMLQTLNFQTLTPIIIRRENQGCECPLQIPQLRAGSRRHISSVTCQETVQRFWLCQLH